MRTSINVNECETVEAQSFASSSDRPFVDIVIGQAKNGHGEVAEVRVQVESAADVDRLEAAVADARTLFPARLAAVTS